MLLDRWLWLPFPAIDFGACAANRLCQQFASKTLNALVKINREVQQCFVCLGFYPDPDSFQCHIVPLLSLSHRAKGTRGRQLPTTGLTPVGYFGNNWASSITLLIGESWWAKFAVSTGIGWALFAPYAFARRREVMEHSEAHDPLKRAMDWMPCCYPGKPETNRGSKQRRDGSF